jgi:hypothetical protein
MSRDPCVYRCQYCHAETNLVEPIGFYGNPRVRCPAIKQVSQTTQSRSEGDVGESQRRHVALQQLVERRDDLEQRLRLYAGDDAGEATDCLYDEYDLVESRIADHRDWFGDRFNDVVDVSEDAPVQRLEGCHSEVDLEVHSRLAGAEAARGDGGEQ